MWHLQMWIEIIVICIGVYLGDLYCGIRPDDMVIPDIVIKAAIIWFLVNMVKIIFEAIKKKRNAKEEREKEANESEEEE